MKAPAVMSMAQRLEQYAPRILPRKVIYQEMDQTDQLVQVPLLGESEFDVVRIAPSIRVVPRVEVWFEAFLRDQALAESQIEFAVVMKVANLLAVEKETREAIVSIRHRSVPYPRDLLEPGYQFILQTNHGPPTPKVPGLKAIVKLSDRPVRVRSLLCWVKPT